MISNTSFTTTVNSNNNLSLFDKSNININKCFKSYSNNSDSSLRIISNTYEEKIFTNNNNFSKSKEDSYSVFNNLNNNQKSFSCIKIEIESNKKENKEKCEYRNNYKRNNFFSLNNTEVKIFQENKTITNLIKKLNLCLEKIIINNIPSGINQSRLRYSPFDLKVSPNISFIDYIKNLFFYSRISPSTLIYSFILIDRLLNSTKLILTNSNIYLILFFSLRIGMKINEDYVLDDDCYCLIGKVNKNFYIQNENFFLEIINYNLYVSKQEYKLYNNLLSRNK